MNNPRILVQNPTQLHVLSEIILRKDRFSDSIVALDTHIDIDTKEILTEHSLVIDPSFKDINFKIEDDISLDFIETETGKELYTYYLKNNVMFEKTAEEDITIDMSNMADTTTSKLTDEEQEVAERSFLQIVNYDLSDDFYSEDVEFYGRKYPDVYLAVFGQSV